MRRNLFWILVIVVLVLGACVSRSGAPKPPDIHYGEDMCTDCGMIINEPRFASAYAHDTGDGRFESFIFDDIGDMLAHMQKNQTLKPVGFWVHDYDSEEWIDAAAAFYVVSDQIKTPMNHGVVAFSTQDAAEKLAGSLEGAKVLDWGKLRVEHAMGDHQH